MPTGQKLLDSLAETWDFFFSDVLPTLQAIFYPVQVRGPQLRDTRDPGHGPTRSRACPWASQNEFPSHNWEIRTFPWYRPVKP